MPAPGSLNKHVISASRRTDIPAFYMDWFMEGLRRGFFEVENPYSRKIFQIPATADNTHTLVFWSKNFDPFIRGAYAERLEDMGFHLFFNFTVNSHHPTLEPGVPSLPDRIEQMETLCRIVNPKAMTWRFDPICHMEDASGNITGNLSDFREIARHAADAGVQRCVTSFVDLYPKVMSRKHPGAIFIDIPVHQKLNILLSMEETLSALGIRLFLCCEKNLIDLLPKTSSIRKAACIPADLLIELYGPGISRAKDQGQRKSQGCGCSVSKDIGSYRLQPCFHNCLFCYANPASPGVSPHE